jgi:hypothetical protein
LGLSKPGWCAAAAGPYCGPASPVSLGCELGFRPRARMNMEFLFLGYIKSVPNFKNSYQIQFLSKIH